MNQLAQDLRAAKALIDTPEKWTKRHYARDTRGISCSVRNKAATCFCSIGALWKVGASWKAEDLLEEAMGVNYIPNFNDNHTHEEVMTAWDKAIAAAEAQS